ncbi:SCO1860 family LAETG-anchored protein [Streptomyces naganishii]|uniref:LPXTG cell wall anchor domain-containing protein n=1 Tax=Streptomyces naganishii JCM 4654 TaxID=1306179 RepID=A0A919CUM9_9ACTN|nr:SCO1860 family LAETG-anchored protein [Streptomyces naganishii]GHD84525.1 LPXTG cell wall anchor domain-containing protein [Streptomyces naganishii JCM 4654]
MNGHNFRMPARRCATVAAATVLAAGPVTPAIAHSGHASADHGRASATVLRTGLDVSLLNREVDVPLTVTLDEVRAPRSAGRTALSARLDGVNGGQPFSVLRADVAKADATVTAGRSEGTVNLTHARVHLPGLPLLSVIELDQVTARATCEAGKAPVAVADVPGAVTVLGKKVTLSAGGPTHVRVPGVGEVRLDLSKRETTSRTAAATALQLTVSVNPLKLNVAQVEGTLTLANATCETPSPTPTAPATAAPTTAASTTDVRPQGAPAAKSDLAETGGSSLTPYLAGGSAVLLTAGGAAAAVARRRRG